MDPLSYAWVSQCRSLLGGQLLQLLKPLVNLKAKSSRGSCRSCRSRKPASISWLSVPHPHHANLTYSLRYIPTYHYVTYVPFFLSKKPVHCVACLLPSRLSVALFDDVSIGCLKPDPLHPLQSSALTSLAPTPRAQLPSQRKLSLKNL